MSFTYAYPRPSVTCDAVVFTLRANDLSVLLIRRKSNPFKDHWALPGGFVNENESLHAAAGRELEEETGVSNARLEQLGAFGEPGRDPRGHTITVAWLTFFASEPRIMAGDDAAAAEWHSFRTIALEPRLPKAPKGPKRIELAFDHAQIIAHGYARLCHHLEHPISDRVFDFLPSRFTLAQLRHVYAAILGHDITPRAFKKQVVDGGLVVATTPRATTSKSAAPLYRWS